LEVFGGGGKTEALLVADDAHIIQPVASGCVLAAPELKPST
jgi:hypothetical protein